MFRQQEIWSPQKEFQSLDRRIVQEPRNYRTDLKALTQSFTRTKSQYPLWVLRCGQHSSFYLLHSVPAKAD